jgi:hypothetical protein
VVDPKFAARRLRAHALFNYTQLDKLRVRLDAVPPFNRIVVAVDPPASTGENADECGIIVAGKGEDCHAYVLADCTSKGDAPDVWAKKVLRASANGRAGLSSDGRRLADLQHRAIGVQPGGRALVIVDAGNQADQDQHDSANQRHSDDLEVGIAVGAYKRMTH